MERTPAETIRDIEVAGRVLGLTVPELCHRAEMSRATWQRIKASKTKPTLDNWNRLLSLKRSLQKRAA